jgi:hypothetical protein
MYLIIKLAIFRVLLVSSQQATALPVLMSQHAIFRRSVNAILDFMKVKWQNVQV